MSDLNAAVERMLAMMERLIDRPAPAIHVHVGPSTAAAADDAEMDPRKKLAEMKKKKFAPIEDHENNGEPVEATRMPHPYIS